MSVNNPQITGVCPNCDEESTFTKSDTPGPYYTCSNCGEEIEQRHIK